MSFLDLSKNLCPNLHVSRIKTDKTNANIKSQTIDITKDIRVYKNNFTIHRDCMIEYESKFDGITINIVFCANHFYKSKSSNFCIYPKPNHTIINYIKNDSGNIFYKKNTQIQNVMISIKPEFLLSFFQNSKSDFSFLQNAKNSLLLKNKTTDINTKICANDIYTYKCQNASDILYIQSKTLEIISLELKELFSQKTKNETGVKFSDYDIKALNLAKEILNKDFQNSPSISELSKMVKLNEFKLKYGFKTFFKTSPYNMFLKNRMLKAKYLIQNSDLNISEIANKLGYKQAHNLASTFKKHFGITPKDYMKKSRKYYY